MCVCVCVCVCVHVFVCIQEVEFSSAFTDKLEVFKYLICK